MARGILLMRKKLFHIQAVDGCARAGVLRTRNTVAFTPLFMPVGTQAALKGLRPDELYALGARMILANSYHLHLRPGEQTVEKAGGVARFMGWPGGVLTDSGGFQVFSLTNLVKVTEDGVGFQSHIDGTRIFLTPEDVVGIQQRLGADIIVPLDQCAPFPCEHKDAEGALVRTNAWARRSLRVRDGSQGFFGIVQGSVYKDLRLRAAREMAKMDFDGFCVGGVSVGEGPELMRDVMDWTLPELPHDKPRYIMGLGRPEDLLDAIAAGADMFDCVMPTRNGRNGQAFTMDGKVRIKNACHAKSRAPLDDMCSCYTCRNFGRDYLRHLFMAREMLGPQLLSLHNVAFYLRLVSMAREAIMGGRFESFRVNMLERLENGN